MTLLENNHVQCDGCPSSGPAIASLHGGWFAQWETIEVGDGAAHLCPGCQEKRDLGVLAGDFVLICARCGRTSLDEPKITQWWALPKHEPGSMSKSVCDECFDAETDSHRPSDAARRLQFQSPSVCS